MTTKTDKILEYVIELKTDMGEVNQHLKNLNGNVQRHEKNIEELYTKTNDNRINTKVLTAKFGIIGAIAGIIGAFILNLISKIWKGQ